MGFGKTGSRPVPQHALPAFGTHPVVIAHRRPAQGAAGRTVPCRWVRPPRNRPPGPCSDDAPQNRVSSSPLVSERVHPTDHRHVPDFFETVPDGETGMFDLITHGQSIPMGDMDGIARSGTPST